MAKPTAEEFINMAKQAGYSDDAIANFLKIGSKKNPKAKAALDILERSPRVPEPRNEALVSELGAEVGDQQEGGMGSAIGRGLKSAATIGGTAAAAYAAGGPIASAIGGLGQAAQELGGDEPTLEGGPQLDPQQPPGGEPQDGEGGLIQDILGRAGQATGTPSMRDLVTLYNTYRRRGGAHTLAQFASTIMRNMSQQGEQGGQAQAQQGMELPQEIAEVGLQNLQQIGEPQTAAVQTASQVLAQGSPLRNLARTFEKRVGTQLEQALLDFLSQQAGGGQVPQGQAQQQGSGGMDFANLSDQQLFQLMQRRNLL